MTIFPTNQVAELLKAKKWNEAGEEIKKWILGQKEENKNPTEIFDAIHAHVVAENKIMDEYLKDLLEYKEILKEIQKLQKHSDESAKIEKIQDKIKDL